MGGGRRSHGVGPQGGAAESGVRRWRGMPGPVRAVRKAGRLRSGWARTSPVPPAGPRSGRRHAPVLSTVADRTPSATSSPHATMNCRSPGRGWPVQRPAALGLCRRLGRESAQLLGGAAQRVEEELGAAGRGARQRGRHGDRRGRWTRRRAAARGSRAPRSRRARRFRLSPRTQDQPAWGPRAAWRCRDRSCCRPGGGRTPSADARR